MSPSGSAKLERRVDPTSYGAMHARVGGRGLSPDATCIVLVHGLVISSLYMIPTAERLALHHRVLAPDLPGFGRSKTTRSALRVPELADALAEWIQACALTRIVLVGNSLGCQVIAELMQRHPEGVVGVVLAGPTVDAGSRAIVSQLARATLDVPREKLSLMPHWVSDFLRAGVRRSWTTMRHALEDRLESKLPALAVPTLVVRGARDPIVSGGWAERVTALLPNGRLRTIERGPHAVNYSSAEEFAELVSEFVGSLAPTATAGADRTG